MHHEDRAGVNAFIRGIDRIGNGRAAGGRHHVHQPARRARSGRQAPCGGHSDLCDGRTRRSGAPCWPSRLQQLGFSKPQIDADCRGDRRADGRDYGFTFSDLTQRLLPAIVLDAYPAQRGERGARR